MNRRSKFIIITFLSILFQVNIAIAIEFKNLKALPEFCNYVMGQKYNHPKSEKYRKTVGLCWTGMHHYCSGLDKINSAILNWKNKQLRVHLIGYAIKEYDYVLRFSYSDCRVKPEILLKKGQALLLIKKDAEAIEALYYAIRLRKDYVPAYAVLSKTFLQKGDIKNARKVIDIGLKYSPDSTELKKVRAGIKKRN